MKYVYKIFNILLIAFGISMGVFLILMLIFHKDERIFVRTILSYSGIILVLIVLLTVFVAVIYIILFLIYCIKNKVFKTVAFRKAVKYNVILFIIFYLLSLAILYIKHRSFSEIDSLFKALQTSLPLLFIQLIYSYKERP